MSVAAARRGDGNRRRLLRNPPHLARGARGPELANLDGHTVVDTTVLAVFEQWRELARIEADVGRLLPHAAALDGDSALGEPCREALGADRRQRVADLATAREQVSALEAAARRTGTLPPRVADGGP